MEILQDLGFRKGGDEAHQQILDPNVTDARTYFNQAQPLLETISVPVLYEMVPNLENYTGRWHPLGFMVYPLGVHESMGSLRLHVYPRDIKQIIPNGSGIHDHAWYLISKVLAGTYTDDRFEIDETPNQTPGEQLPGDLLRVFRATKTPGKPDALTTDGTIVRASLTEQLVVPAGATHTIEPGVFHLPTIGLNQFAATLVLDSPSLGYKPRILINRSPDPIINPRPNITTEHALIAKAQILG